MEPTSKRSPVRGHHAFTLLLAVALAVAGGCGRGAGESADSSPNAPRPVSGRVDTGTGLSLDFPDGWAEMPTQGRTFTKYYENKERQLALGINDFPTTGESIWTMGEQVKRRLGHDGTIEEGSPVRVDGREAFRVVSALKTNTGRGRVVGLVIIRSPDRASSLFLSSTADEREHHRAEMEELLASVKVS